MASFFSRLFGSSPKLKNVPTTTPQQQQFQQWLMSQLQQPTGEGIGFLQQILGGGDEAFQDFEAPFQRQYQQQTIPAIAERFAGSGSGGGLDSSGLNLALAQSGRELSENLASMRGGLKMNALQQLQGLLAPTQQKMFQPTYTPGTTGLLGGLLQGAGSGFGSAATQFYGNKYLSGLGGAPGMGYSAGSGNNQYYL